MRQAALSPGRARRRPRLLVILCREEVGMKPAETTHQEHGEDRILAVGLLTAADLRAQPGSAPVYPVDQTPRLGEILRAIDEAEGTVRLARQTSESAPTPLRR
jgi:hypothetical protein